MQLMPTVLAEVSHRSLRPAYLQSGLPVKAVCIAATSRFWDTPAGPGGQCLCCWPCRSLRRSSPARDAVIVFGIIGLHDQLRNPTKTRHVSWPHSKLSTEALQTVSDGSVETLASCQPACQPCWERTSALANVATLSEPRALMSIASVPCGESNAALATTVSNAPCKPMWTHNAIARRP